MGDGVVAVAVAEISPASPEVVVYDDGISAGRVSVIVCMAGDLK